MGIKLSTLCLFSLLAHKTTLIYTYSIVRETYKTLVTINNMEKYNNKFLANIILDLVDGIYGDYDLVENFGLNEKQAKQIWTVIETLRANK